MIEPHYRRISGLHVEDDGVTGVVWIAQDPDTTVTYIYDTATFRAEPPVVIVDGITARGRWIPLAWPKGARDFADQLMEHGVNTLPDPCSDQQTSVEQAARQVLGAFKAQRLRVLPHLGSWQEEFKLFYREDSQVPKDGFPLMSATRHAVENMEWAVAQSFSRSSKVNYPEIKVT